MSDTQKTIRMPQETLDKWLAALRSGEYKQCKGMLHKEHAGGYCCLGVLQMVVDGDVETDIAGSLELPTLGWLEDRNIEFNSLGRPNADHRSNPYIPSCSQYVSNLNDEGMPFTEIADLIEKHAVGV